MYDGGMNEIKQLAKRLRAVKNLSLFARTYGLQYRTLTRIRSLQPGAALYVPTYSTILAVTKALDKAGF